jgi:hypothetical protein
LIKLFILYPERPPNIDTALKFSIKVKCKIYNNFNINRFILYMHHILLVISKILDSKNQKLSLYHRYARMHDYHTSTMEKYI